MLSDLCQFLCCSVIMEPFKQLDLCTIGLMLGEGCHKSTFLRSTGLIKIATLTPEDQVNLIARTGCHLHPPELVEETVCFHHEKKYITRYSELQKQCCNPFGTHSKRKQIKKQCSLRAISHSLSCLINNVTSSNIKPGQKLCTNCFSAANKLECKEPIVESSTSYSDSDLEILQARDEVDRSLGSIDISPIRLHKLNQKDKVKYVKRKGEDAADAIATKIAKVAHVEKQSIQPTPSTSDNCEDCLALVNDIKEKCRQEKPTRREMTSLLTLLPKHWTYGRIKSEFSEFGNITKYTMQQAKKLRAECGILANLPKKKGRPMSVETRERVIKFLCDDEISRTCAGAKDTVTVKIDGNKQKVTKRLLLANMHELYVEFRKRNPENSIGFSAFCAIRQEYCPYCVPVTSSGMHTVCVCEIHQNAKLILAAAPVTIDYKEAMQKIVCDLSSRDCMIHA